jgi:hypothetical protein
VSKPQTDERVEQDPLLDFSIEAARTARPESPPDGGQLPATTMVTDALAEMRRRVDHLDQEIERTTQQIHALRSDIATLVSSKKHIRSARRDRSLGLIGATAAVAMGIAASAWLWMSTSAEPLAESPQVIASEPLPDQPVQALAPPTAIAQVSAVTRSPERALPRPAPSRSPQPSRVDYIGTLTIDSDPPGEVTIDGKPAGRTPVRAEGLKAGSHLVWIEREGYRRFTRVVQVPANRVTRLVTNLEPLASR